jgi:hypothetical protein
MYTTEVEKGHVQVNSGGQMFERLTESETQPRKTPQMRPHAQVRPLDVARADSFDLRVSADAYWDGRRHFRGVVPLRAFTVSRSVELEQLGEVDVRSEVFLDGRDVAAKPIRRDLESSRDALAQILDELIGADTFALCDQIRQDHFCFAVNCHPDVLVAPLFRTVAVQMGFLGVNEGPEFVRLHEARKNIPHAGIEKASGFLTDREKQGQNRALVDASSAGDSADTHSFKQERDDLHGLFSRDIVPSKGPLARLGESRFASRAAVTLDSISCESESLCFGVFAANARHFRPCLSCRASRKCVLRSALRLTPRADLAPSRVDAPGGVFFLCLLLYRHSRNHVTEFGRRLRRNPESLINPGQRFRSSGYHQHICCRVSRSAVGPFGYFPDLALLFKTSKDRVYGSQQISISAGIESLRFEMQSHLLRSKRPSMAEGRKRESNSVGQSEAALKVQIFLTAEFRENGYGLSQVADALLKLLCACLSFAKFGNRLREFFLGLLERYFVSLWTHDS